MISSKIHIMLQKRCVNNVQCCIIHTSRKNVDALEMSRARRKRRKKPQQKMRQNYHENYTTKNLFRLNMRSNHNADPFENCVRWLKFIIKTRVRSHFCRWVYAISLKYNIIMVKAFRCLHWQNDCILARNFTCLTK